MIRPLFSYWLARSWISAHTAPVGCRQSWAFHLAAFTASRAGALVFTSSTGAPLRHNNFRRRHWLPSLAAANLAGTHFHDLRHTENTLTAGKGQLCAS
jgi:hypothetical protein